jgi:hypothetical protein
LRALLSESGLPPPVLDATTTDDTNSTPDADDATSSTTTATTTTTTNIDEQRDVAQRIGAAMAREVDAARLARGIAQVDNPHHRSIVWLTFCFIFAFQFFS